MADTFQFDLVSPERSLASFAATEVQIPGADGDLTAMPGHAPVITPLRPGVIRAMGYGSEKDFVVTSGFVDVTAASVSVIAERAHPVSEITKADLEDVIVEAKAKATEATDEHKDGAEKFVADLVALVDAMD
ncbi:MAG: F0F1 ATP synthase subunit epsilon [Rhodobacteraceae bacterium]|nr:F0F1 ATP synthase subunit epsilon [Paracoccaceae bacterium]